MTHTLTFSSIYKSIVTLDTTEVPNFVVLTGRNGSGKTHLLEALDNGSVKSNLTSDYQRDILLYDWDNIIPKDTGIFDPSQYQTKRSNWFNQIRTQQDQVFPKLQEQAIKLGIPVEHCSSIRKLKLLNESKLTEIFSDADKAKKVYQKLREQIQQYGRNIGQQTQRHINNEDTWKKLAPEVIKERPELFLETSESKFFNNEKLLWGEVDPFQQAFGRLFSTYRELIHQNDRLEKYPPPEDSELRHLDDEEFRKTYGEPPWNFVNKILETCNLDFRVEGPPLHEVSSYEPRLRKVTADVEMKFQDLSSGEKVLMSFALCLYNASDLRQQKHFPKLLLLDEVDAPLHPSMVRSLLNTIQEVLVDGKDVSVILTTHSPSTVALAPEESLYEMNPSGPSIEKTTKSQAVSILTAGVPTLSVSFDGRRQVFVESKTDAQIYEKLYQLYKTYLQSEQSLNFIEVGNSNESGGEANSGCVQVNRLVNNLVHNGNASVFGLIDWDRCNNPPNERIKVLSHQLRNGIESLLFDPVLIATTVIKENLPYCQEKNLVSQEDTYTSISVWEEAKWQEVANVVQIHILGNCDSSCEHLKVKYLNGMSLKIRKDYLHLDDHKLESAIVDSFGFLKPKNNRAGKLMNHICDSILPDYPSLMPSDLLTTFKELLNETI